MSMSIEQVAAGIGLVFMLISTAILIGLWRGRREAAEKAAMEAIHHVDQIYGLKIQGVEKDIAGLKNTVDLKIGGLDKDISSLRMEVGSVRQQIANSDIQRATDFERLHKRANDTHELLVKWHADLSKSFIPRPEYEARHESMTRRIDRLEGGNVE
jgi:hypothetical protein